MEQVFNLTDPDSAENRETIAARVLADTGLDDAFMPSEATRIRVNYGDLLGNGNQDILITVSFGPDRNVMAVYSEGENGHVYEGQIGQFGGVDNIRIVRPSAAPVDGIYFRERSDQAVGGFERGSYYRGYEKKGDRFKNTISFDENIESWWNEGYVGGKHNWSRILQTTKVERNEDYSHIHLEKTQVYSTANTTGVLKPREDQFYEQERRVVHEHYNWDNEFEAYVLDKKIENKTGEVVGILFDYGHSPYEFVGEISDMYRIARKDGTVDIVSYDALSDIEPSNAN